MRAIACLDRSVQGAISGGSTFDPRRFHPSHLLRASICCMRRRILSIAQHTVDIALMKHPSSEADAPHLKA
jgi:hypothetical protein